MFLLEGRRVEAVGEHRSPSDDVLSRLKLFGVLFQHFCLDGVAQGFGLCLGFFENGFPFVEGFDFLDEFGVRQGFVVSLQFVR